jgi:hypothetical protein
MGKSWAYWPTLFVCGHISVKLLTVSLDMQSKNLHLQVFFSSDVDRIILRRFEDD